jgi:macrolide-specific efflux system membrane fusion protein
MRIADLATMTVWTQVSEADVTRLKDGMPVYFTTLGHGDRRWTATVRQILPAPAKSERAPGQSDANTGAPSAANNVVLYTVLFDVDNAAGDLRPEMTAQVFFVAARVTNAVIAPVAALHPAKGRTDKTTVTVIDGSNITSERAVTIGLRTRFQAEIVSGLETGERVVTGAKRGADGPSLVGFRL